MSSRRQVLHTWDAQLHSLLPQVRRTRVRVLALFVLGVLWAGQLTLLRVAAALPLPVRDVSRERRLQRWLANPAVTWEAVGRPLWPALLAGTADREVVLVWDPTPQTDWATILVLGLVDHKRILPVAWQVMPQRAPWAVPRAVVLRQLGQAVNAAMPPGCTVTMVADRGSTGPAILEVCAELGWPVVLRLSVTERTTHRVRGGRVGAERGVWELVTGPGQRWTGAVEVFKKEGWRAVELTIWWERGEAGPWILLSDRPAGAARVREHRRRARGEATYQDCKRRGWNIEHSKLRHPARFERLLVLHLALWWVHHLGRRVIRQGQRKEYDRAARRDLSLRRLGLAWLQDPDAPDRTPPLPFHQRHGQWRFAGLT